MNRVCCIAHDCCWKIASGPGIHGYITSWKLEINPANDSLNIAFKDDKASMFLVSNHVLCFHAFYVLLLSFKENNQEVSI